MAVTLTTRPISGGSNWNAAGNPIVYKFTSTGHGALVNYRIEVEVFRASDDTSLTGGVKFSYSPNLSGITFADVSAIVKNYISADWELPASLNELDEDASLRFYIKYQELYDGSAVAVVDDVANPIHAVFAAMQIGSANGGNMLAYVPATDDDSKLWLTKFATPKLWRGWPFTLSFIHPDASALWVIRKQYNAAGNLLTSSLTELDDTQDNGVNRLKVIIDEFSLEYFPLDAAATTITAQLATKVQILSDPGFDVGIGGDWSNVVDGTPNNPWVNSGGVSIAVSLDNPGTPVLYSQVAFQTLAQTYPAGDYILRLNAAQSGAGITNMVIKLYSGGVLLPPGAAYDSSSTPIPNVAGNVEFAFTAFDPFDGVGLQVRRVVGVDTRTIFFHNAELLQTVPCSEDLTINVEDACDNPVLLQWKNSAGGDAEYLFAHGQEFYNVLGTNRKAKRMVLFAMGLTREDFAAIDELNSTGEVYRPPMQELTATTNRTTERAGQQVYVLDQDGNKTGVLVIPTSERQFTRHETHMISIEIEFPEVLSI